MPELARIPHRLLDEHAFLLLDQAHTQGDFWQQLPGSPIAPALLAGERDALPRLVAVAWLDRDQRTRMLDHLLTASPEAPRPVAALLATAVNHDKLVEHLRARLIVTIPEQGKHLFRYYDPRVFRHVLWMATPAQVATLFGPVETWTWCNHQGDWYSSHPPEGMRPELAFRPRGLDLARIGVLERCLKALRQTLSGFIDDADNVQARRVNALLDAARLHGLTDEADLRLYVVQAIRFHPDIHGHPELARRLRTAGLDDSYVGACSDLDADTLTRYAREIASPRKEHA